MIDLFSSKSKAQDKEKLDNFIPVVCHYNNNTLLTKSGELIQTIQIDGLGADRPPLDMRNLRKFIRTIIFKHLDSKDIACWITNIRFRTSIDVDSSYPYEFSKHVHEVWSDKNHLHDKYVNVMYISFIHKKMPLSSKYINEIIDSFYFSVVSNKHNNYLIQAHENLNIVVDNIIEALSAKVQPKKLGLISKKEKIYSENISFYNRIISKENKLIPLSKMDIAHEFSSNKIHLSERYLNIAGKQNTKTSKEQDNNFVSILAIKDYYEVSEKLLFQFLSLPLEMCITEAFFPISPTDKIIKDKEYQKHISVVSKDEDFNALVTNMNSDNTDYNRSNNFYSRQITIALYGENVESLESNIKIASEKLNSIGLLHVLEDILLEHGFLSQLPGNFHYLRRISCVNFQELAAMAILHDANCGLKFNDFGKAVTIFRNLQGLPYYFNFHNSQGKANFCIIGTPKSGKTFLTNFLLSESTKYDHKILYLTTDEKSKILIESMNGVWEKEPSINPFLDRNIKNDLLKLKNLCLILGNAYNKSLSETQITQLSEFVELLQNMQPQDRSKENIIAQMQDNDLKRLLSELINNDDYVNLFSTKDNTEAIIKNKVVAFNLNSLTNDYYFNKYNDTAILPKERERFSANLDLNDNIKATIVSSLLEEFFISPHQGIKILVVDEVLKILDNPIFGDFMNLTKDFVDKGNIVILTCCTQLLGKENVCKAAKSIINDSNVTKAIMAGEKLPINYSEVLGISLAELDLVNRIPLENRSFILKQNNECIALELSLGGIPVIASILSADKELLKVYDKIKSESSDNKEALHLIYERLENVHN